MSSTTGSCLCSQVKYTFTGEPAKQAICHCHTCHKISGSAYTTNIVIPAPAFKITSGSDLIKIYTTIHETGMTILVHFCSNCATVIYKEGDNEMFKGTVILQAGTLDDDGSGMGFYDVKPEAELWVKRRAKWLGGLDDVVQLQEFS